MRKGAKLPPEGEGWKKTTPTHQLAQRLQRQEVAVARVILHQQEGAPGHFLAGKRPFFFF